MPPASVLIQVRSTLLMALAVFGLATLCWRIGYQDPHLPLLWAPPSLVMMAYLARGPRCAIGALLGLLAWGWSVRWPWSAMIPMLAGSVLSPLIAAYAFRLYCELRPERSNLVIATRMLAIIAFVHAPLAATFDLLTVRQLGLFAMPAWQVWVGAFVIEAMSGVVLVRAMLALVPDVPGPVCPVDMTRGSMRGLGRAEWMLLAAVLGVGAATGWAAANGHTLHARLLVLPLFACGLIAALITSRRFCAALLLLIVPLMVALRVAMEPFSIEPAHLTNIGQFEIMLIVGGAVLHLLNAAYAERAAQQQRLEQQAFTNEISGLPNLRALQTGLQGLCETGVCGQLMLTELAFVDFAGWSDLAGRQRLEGLERLIAERLGSMFPDARMVAHVGTGRFVIVVDRARDSVDSVRDRLRLGLDGQRLEPRPDSLLLRASIGIVDTSGSPNVDVDSMLASLSMAQQRAATSPGRFHAQALSADQIDEYRAHLHWVEEVRHAIHLGRVQLLAQPIVPAGPYRAGGERVPHGLHFEILARLIDDRGQTVSPARFLPAIAQARLLEQFDRIVIEQTFGQLAGDLALYQATECCAINITGPTLCDPAFPEFLAQRLEHHMLRPSLITLEITESDSITSLESAVRNATRLKRLGVSLAIDDFGTGLATFDYLRRFKPDWLKIDGSFVLGYEEDPLTREIVLSTIRAARVIGARVVAEFVESSAIAHRMAGIGVDYLQGYAIDRPMPLAGLVEADARRRGLVPRSLGHETVAPA